MNTECITPRLRMATPEDLPVIMRHRRLMFVDMGFRDETTLNRMEETSLPFIKAALMDGTYLGWLVESDGNVIAGGGLLLYERPSSPRDTTTHRAVIMNVFTEAEFRRRGLARFLVGNIIAWCREHGHRYVFLHASNDGRHLYEQLGFVPTTEMQLDLRPQG
jgi:GNAT superfamily N-acetyltransferase